MFLDRGAILERYHLYIYCTEEVVNGTRTHVSRTSKLAIKRFAKLGANFVPIATPLTCRKNNSPKLKQLYLSTKFNKVLIMVTGGYRGLL